jgi:SecD/SecF fusion protein
MNKKNIVVAVILLIILVFAVCTLVYPLFGRKEMRLGLDLVGGVNLVYQVQFPENVSLEEKANDMDRVLTTIEDRIDRYGVTEPIIQQVGSDRIMVQLPGFTDIEAAKSLVEQTGFLEFREVELNPEGMPVVLGDYLNGSVTGFIDTKEEGNRIFVDEEGNFVAFLVKDNKGLEFIDKDGKPVDNAKLQQNSQDLSWIAARGTDGTQLTGAFLAEAKPTIAQGSVNNEPEIAINWNSKGAEIFDQIAQRIYNSGEYGTPQRALGIFLDSNLISSPQIREAAYHGNAVISGNFTYKEVERLSNLLESGALPVPLVKPPLYQNNVSATLGADFIHMSIKAGLIGIILVILFMILYYRLLGFLSGLALLFYGTIVLALFKLIPVTLDLAGLGGFILSIGMAVDANVLIFERMKEEFRLGRSLRSAIEVGFQRAWPSIRDSNITTLIVCIVLYWMGSSIVASAPVKGFAVTLTIGVLVSMFTAIIVTRTLLRFLAGSPLADRMSLFNPVPVKPGSEPSIQREKGRKIFFDIAGKKMWYFLISGTVIVIGLISLLTFGLKTGIEFSSGSVLTIQFEQAVEQGKLSQEITGLGYHTIVQSMGKNEFLIRTQEITGDQKKQLENALTEKFGPLTETEFSSVSPIIAGETTRNAGIAVAVAAVGVLLYVTWAFRRMPNPFRYGACAVIALVHDALVPLGIFSILGFMLNWQINLMFITGILAVVGYSVNDTVVIFDRIRDNLQSKRNVDFQTVVNDSLVETIGRSLNTSLTTLLTVLALLLFVGSAIQNFTVVLLIGIVAGTYSSICIAAPLLVVWTGQKSHKAVPVSNNA